jgi:spore coat protein U-like protein
MPLILRLLVLLAALCGASPALAACTVAGNSALTFAPGSTYDVREGRVNAVAGQAGFTCNGSLISLVSTNSARAQATSANGFTLRNGGASIPYRLSADTAGSWSFNGGATIDYFDPSLLSLLGILNAGSFAPPITATVTGAPNLPPGTYTDVVTMRWDWSVCHGVGLGGLCILGETGSATATITVTLTVSADCRVVAPNLSFGAAPLVSGFAPVRQAVAVDCSLGTAYAVAFSAGTSGVSRPWRSMKSGAGNALRYNIYRTDGTTIWDETTPLAAGTPGTGATTPLQLHSYVARIDPGQATPPAASYADTVSVIVTF